MKLEFDQEQGSVIFQNSAEDVNFVTESGERLCVDVQKNDIQLTYNGVIYYNQRGEIVKAKNERKKESIEDKIQKLYQLTTNFPYIEFYPHESFDCFKIDNEYTDFKKDTVVLGRFDERFDKILDKAIEVITEKKDDHENLPF